MIKKILIAVGAFVLIAVAGIGVYLYILSREGEALDAESKQYADMAVRAVIANWDPKELENRASPELKSSSGDGGLAKLMEVTKRLGGLKQFEGVKGEANIHVSPDRGKVITATYVGRPVFEQGPADIRIQLVKRAQGWQIQGFNVKSPALLGPAPKPEAQAAAEAPAPPPSSTPAATPAAPAPDKSAAVAKPVAVAAATAKPAPAPAMKVAAPKRAPAAAAEPAGEKPKAKRRAAPRKPVAPTLAPAVASGPTPTPLVQSAKYNDVMTAVMNRDRVGAAEVLGMGFWADRVDSNGVTPLMAAASNGDAAMVQLLLQHGANPNRSGPGGSVLTYAGKSGDRKIADLLRKAGAR